MNLEKTPTEAVIISCVLSVFCSLSLSPIVLNNEENVIDRPASFGVVGEVVWGLFFDA